MNSWTHSRASLQSISHRLGLGDTRQSTLHFLPNVHQRIPLVHHGILVEADDVAGGGRADGLAEVAIGVVEGSQFLTTRDSLSRRDAGQKNSRIGGADPGGVLDDARGGLCGWDVVAHVQIVHEPERAVNAFLDGELVEASGFTALIHENLFPLAGSPLARSEER